MHFGCYKLTAIKDKPDLLYTIGEGGHTAGVLPEIIQSFGLVVPDQLTSAFLGEVIGKVAPSRLLQENIAHIHKYLGEDTFEICTDWLVRTRAMAAHHGSFCDPSVATPGQYDTLVFTGGTANWMERRLAIAKQIHPDTVGQVLLPIGNRAMAADEHAQVQSYVDTYGRAPVEWDYAEKFIVPVLKLAGFGTIRLVAVENGSASKILDSFFSQTPELLRPEHTTLVVGNAPNVLQSAGQFRLAGINVDPSYDAQADQLYMVSDTFAIAAEGQPAAQAQNPISALGQILRNFKILLENAESSAMAAV